MAGKVIMVLRVEGLCRLLSFILYYGPSGLLLILQKFSILRSFIDEEIGEVNFLIESLISCISGRKKLAMFNLFNICGHLWHYKIWYLLIKTAYDSISLKLFKDIC